MKSCKECGKEGCLLNATEGYCLDCPECGVNWKEKKMELYKNEDLCIECKNEFFSKPYDPRDPTPGQLGYCIKCDNFLIKERKMEFLKERVFTSLNADELRAGDKVIVSYNLYGLKEQVKMFTKSAIDVIEVIQDEDYFNRFKVKHGESFPLAYLVERAENCTNCGAIYTCAFQVREHPELEKCKNWKPKTEQKAEKCEDCKKAYTDYPCVANVYHDATGRACENFEAEKHFRPFKDTDELIKVWNKKFYLDFKPSHDPLTMPLIWVRDPKRPKVNYLLNGLMGNEVHWGSCIFNMQELFDNFEFLDGTPCGVEE